MTSGQSVASADDAARLAERLADALHDLGAGMGAAECHGMLCGLLVSLPDDREQRARAVADWLGSVAPPDAPAAAREPGLAVLDDVWRASVEMLESEECAFFPLLPGEERPIGARSRELGRWCAGFLSGLGTTGGLGETGGPAAVAEFVRDLSEIARVEPSPDADEASEAALAEIVEYVRVGVLLVRTELAASRGAGAAE